MGALRPEVINVPASGPLQGCRQPRLLGPLGVPELTPSGTARATPEVDKGGCAPDNPATKVPIRPRETRFPGGLMGVVGHGVPLISFLYVDRLPSQGPGCHRVGRGSLQPRRRGARVTAGRQPLRLGKGRHARGLLLPGDLQRMPGQLQGKRVGVSEFNRGQVGGGWTRCPN